MDTASFSSAIRSTRRFACLETSLIESVCTSTEEAISSVEAVVCSETAEIFSIEETTTYLGYGIFLIVINHIRIIYHIYKIMRLGQDNRYGLLNVFSRLFPLLRKISHFIRNNRESFAMHPSSRSLNGSVNGQNIRLCRDFEYRFRNELLIY
ncbi:hypothetical protein [Paenibacillus psychroresistens]|nr:hypothetical protein [Paenibacillus psychroresistens]